MTDIYIKDEGMFKTVTFNTEKAKEYYRAHLTQKFENRVQDGSEFISISVLNSHLRQLVPQFGAAKLDVDCEVDYKLPEFKLKNIKHNPDLSEETPAFTADIYQNGQCMAHVKNHGRGGGNCITPAKGFTYHDVAIFDNMDIESAIFELVETHTIVKSKQSAAFVLVDANGQIFTQKFPMKVTNLKRASNYNEWLTAKKTQFAKKGYSVMNTNL